jgi:hypothetical protein
MTKRIVMRGDLDLPGGGVFVFVGAVLAWGVAAVGAFMIVGAGAGCAVGILA